MHSIQNIWLQPILTAARSRNRSTITNRTFVPHDITSFPEWIRTRQPTDKRTAKIHRLKQVRNVLKMIFWVAEICQEATEVPLAYRLTNWALWKQWSALLIIDILVVFVPIDVTLRQCLLCFSTPRNPRIVITFIKLSLYFQWFIFCSVKLIRYSMVHIFVH